MAGFLIVLQLEERDLMTVFGEKYERYSQRVPMLFPWPKHEKPSEEHA